MDALLDELTIGALAQAGGVTVEAVRFYQRRGLLRQPDRPYGGIRRYGAADVGRLRFVKSAQRLGFSLDEVAELLRLEDGTHCREASRLAEGKLADVREKRAQLARMEATLAALVGACHNRKGRASCPLIASLLDDSPEPRRSRSTRPATQAGPVRSRHRGATGGNLRRPERAAGSA